MARKRIRIGTRSSKLALWQAHYVAGLLEAGGFRPELVPIETKGDKTLDATLSKIGGKGVFTEELEASLRMGTIDIAVHSAKDLPSTLPEGFHILSFCERGSPEDVIISHGEIDLNDPGLILGTSSARRVALLKHFYPHIKTIGARGNLQTRIGKLQTGLMHGLVLAHAGVKRMELNGMVKYRFDIGRFTPPVGQGAVAVEIHERLGPTLAGQIKRCTNHSQTEKLMAVERSFLRTMDGGCSIPVFGMAQMKSDGPIELTGGIVSLDGKQLVRRTVYGAGESLGASLAEGILAGGGKKILDDIKSII